MFSLGPSNLDQSHLSEFGSTASASENSSQLPISLYPKSLSEPLNASFPMTSAVQNPTYTTSVITSSTLTSSSVSSTSPVTTCSSYDQSSVHTRIAYQSPASPADAAPGSVANGHGGGRSQHTVDTTSSVPAPKKTDPSALPSVSSLPSPSSCTALLPPSSQHTATLPALTPGELSSSPFLSSAAPSLATRAACPLPMQRGPQARHTLMPVWRAPHPQLPSQQPLLLQVPRPQGLPCLGA